MGGREGPLWARREPVWGVWIKAADPWLILAWLVGC